MVKFILKRIGTMIIAMFMIILITFTLMHSIPGGPFTNTKGVPEEVTQAMEAKYGLDQPMPVQFVKYLGWKNSIVKCNNFLLIFLYILSHHNKAVNIHSFVGSLL